MGLDQKFNTPSFANGGLHSRMKITKNYLSPFQEIWEPWYNNRILMTIKK